MTVPSTSRRAGPFLGNDSTTVFSFSFKTFAAGDLLVTKTSASNVETTLTLATDYTVTLNGDQDASPGGTITYPVSGSPLAFGEKLTIIGDLEYEQTTDLLGGGAFNARVIEDTFDRAVIQIQQVDERVDRALTLPVSASSVSTTLPLPQAGLVIGWNTSGTGLQNYDVDEVESPYGNWTYSTFTGNGTTTAFALAKAPGNIANVDVSINGLSQVPVVDFSLSGALLTFVTAPPNGTEILARYGLSTTQAFPSYSSEQFTATAGQTIFNLTSATYVPGSSNVAVYVNGLRMVSGADYIETNSSRITFTSALTLGDEVSIVFGREFPDGLDSSSVGFAQAGTGAVARTVQSKLRDVVSVKDFGAVGDGVTNDTAAIQAAIDSLAAIGGVVYFPSGEYRIARNIGTNDRWGVKVTGSNITLKGDQASLRRFNTDISTYALSYPLVFVGTPDSNIAAQTQNVFVEGLDFIGENIRHAVPGSAIIDFRTAIVFKNTKNTSVQNCAFIKIDSSAICYQQIATYDSVNLVYYNKTKNYHSKINNCRFVAEPHATAGRAQLHCVNADGVDGLIIDGNHFEWTDVCLSGESTYDTADQSENAVFTYASPASRNALGAVKRQGRDVVFSNNNCINCSEHPVYPAMVSVVISGNTITTDTPLICNAAPIQLRCRGVTVSGNTITGYPSAVAIVEPSSQVAVSGNVFYSTDLYDSEGGAIAINSNGLTSYITNRSSYLTYLPMDDIAVTGNVLVGPKTVIPTDATYQNGVRVYTGTADATNYPNGKIFNVNISGNTFKFWQNGIYMINNQYKNMVVSNNNFTAKPFVQAGFNASTVMRTRSAVQVNGADSDEARFMTFTNNNVFGADYMIASRTGAGTALSLYPVEQFSNNKVDYIKNTKTADIRDFDALTNFRGNVSIAYLDRTFSTAMLFNALYSGSGSSERKYNILYIPGSGVRFYTDDAGTFIAL